MAARHSAKKPAAGLTLVQAKPQATDAIVFVHGLDGHPLNSWGALDDSGAFLHRMAADFPHHAIGYLSYASDLSYYFNDPRQTLIDTAQEVTEALRRQPLNKFHRMNVIGHCMGGYLMRLALCDLAVSTGEMARISLFGLDCPETWPTAGPDNRMSGLLRCLGVTQESFDLNAAWWIAQSTNPHLHYHAVLSNAENWITPFGLGSTVPVERCYTADCDHLALAQISRHGNVSHYDYIASAIRDRSKGQQT